MAELVAHIGGVYATVTTCLNSGGTDSPNVGSFFKQTTAYEINDWFVERRTSLLDALSSVDPATETCTFTRPQPSLIHI